MRCLLHISKPKIKESDKDQYDNLIIAMIQGLNLNIELEHGLFTKENISIMNTINITLEVSNTKLELSNKAITMFFKLIVNKLN